MLTAALCWLAAAGLVSAPQSGDDDDPTAVFRNQDAVSYDIELDIDIEHQRVAGRVRYVFRAVDEAIDRLRLHARQAERGGGEWVVAFHDADGRDLTSTPGIGAMHQTLEVDLRRRFAPGEEIALSAEMSGTPPGGLRFVRNRYDAPMAVTDHYPEGARGWLPCNDTPYDRARFRVTLSYPTGNVAVASGQPLAVEPGRARPDRVFWRSETRCDIAPYGFAIAVGPFARVDEAGDPRLLPHFVYKQDVATARGVLTQHAEWMRIMERTFGEYAFAKYTTVQCPTRFGGFEAPGNTQVSERLYQMDDRASEILAHELAHMWFGGAVGFESWCDVWLGDAFATYFGHWLREQTGGPTLQDSMRALRDTWMRTLDSRRKPLRLVQLDDPERAMNANTGAKGAWLLHMLRAELGDTLFFAAMRDYYLAYRGKTATAGGLAETIWRSTGRQMVWFLVQWLDRPGCPEVRVRLHDGQLQVHQIQPGPPYRFRLPVQWTDADGRQRRSVVETDRRALAVHLGDGARDLVVDPDAELLFRLRRLP